MYGDLLLMERDGGPTVRAEGLAFGETGGRDERWLQQLLFEHPELLPLGDIDPAFGPVVPLCREMRTRAGPIDIAFMNPSGYLTLVECKLWRNPQARREVVGQILDYARCVGEWSYSDLQREIARATKSSGNVPFDIVRAKHPTLPEERFVDDVTRALRAGRFLLLIAGDGIREDVGGITTLINRNATSAFSFGLVEVALYGFQDGAIAVQPRVTAKTQLIERTLVLVNSQAGAVSGVRELEGVESPRREAPGDNTLGESTQQAEYRRWWTPVMQMQFDDREQEPPRLYWRNHVRSDLPWTSPVWLVAYRSAVDELVGVYIAGRGEPYQDLIASLAQERDDILRELPHGTEYRSFETAAVHTFIVKRRLSDFSNDDEARAWLRHTLNAFSNAFRPRLKHRVRPVNA